MDSKSPIKKVCVAKLCRKVDLTDFSSCRFCGAPYDLAKYRRDHVLRKPPFEIGEYIKSPTGFVVLMVVAVALNSLRTGALSTIIGKTFKKADSDLRSTDPKLKNKVLTYNDFLRRGDAYWVHTMTYEACDAYSAAINLQPGVPLAYEKRALMYDAIGAQELAEKDRHSANQLRLK